MNHSIRACCLPVIAVFLTTFCLCERANGQVEPLDEPAKTQPIELESRQLDEPQASDSKDPTENTDPMENHDDPMENTEPMDKPAAATLKTPKLKQLPLVNQNFGRSVTTVKNFQWAAPDITYNNLLFEEPLLERHGYSSDLKHQPFISGINFYKTAIFLGPKIIQGHHKRCDNPLGWGAPRNFPSCWGR